MRFIRKNGRIIPIREKGDIQKSSVGVIGATVAVKAINRDSIKAKAFTSNTYSGPLSYKLQTVSNGKKFLPRAFAITRDNSVGGKRVMFASTLFQKERAGWGKRLFASVQFNAIKEGKTNISGSIISTSALRFTKNESSKYFLGGRGVDYIAAKKAIKKGFVPTAITQLNPKNRSYIGFGMKPSKSTNRFALAIGSTIAAGALYSLLKKKDRK